MVSTSDEPAPAEMTFVGSRGITSSVATVEHVVVDDEPRVATMPGAASPEILTSGRRTSFGGAGHAAAGGAYSVTGSGDGSATASEAEALGAALGLGTGLGAVADVESGLGETTGTVITRDGRVWRAPIATAIARRA